MFIKRQFHVYIYKPLACFDIGTMTMPLISLYPLFLTCDVYITDCLHSKYVNYSFEENSFAVRDVIK